MTISLYCNCFRDKINKKTEYIQKNLMLGSFSYEKELREKLLNENFIFDDYGHNISNLNKWFGQLTGLYWVWKNTKEEIVGTNTYRLFWGDYFLHNNFKKNTIYIPEKLNLKNYLDNPREQNISIYDQYSYCHGEINLSFLYQLSDKNLIPIKPYMIENLKDEYYMYPYNMFITERKTFNSLCSLLFQILFKFFDSYKNHFDEYEEIYRQSRILDFLAERILHIVYSNIDYYFTNIDIETVSIIELNH